MELKNEKELLCEKIQDKIDSISDIKMVYKLKRLLYAIEQL